jgi:hypothetical protein
MMLAVVLLAIMAHLAARAAVPVSFTQNYLSSTDANHTRVLSAELVELVLDQDSGNLLLELEQ